MNLQPDIWLLIEVCKKRRTQDGRLSKKKDGSQGLLATQNQYLLGVLIHFCDPDLEV